jgi:hypothetical protein
MQVGLRRAARLSERLRGGGSGEEQRSSARLPSVAQVSETLQRLWRDLPCRALLCLAVAGAWFTVALVDPRVLVVPLLAVAGLRWRLRSGAVADAEPDEWF